MAICTGFREAISRTEFLQNGVTARRAQHYSRRFEMFLWRGQENEGRFDFSEEKGRIALRNAWGERLAGPSNRKSWKC